MLSAAREQGCHELCARRLSYRTNGNSTKLAWPGAW